MPCHPTGGCWPRSDRGCSAWPGSAPPERSPCWSPPNAPPSPARRSDPTRPSRCSSWSWSTTIRSGPASTARGPLGFLSTMPAYQANFRRMGFTDDDIASLSDRLVDALVPGGSPESIAEHVEAQRAAGADHVSVSLVSAGDRPPLDEWRSLADASAPLTSGPRAPFRRQRSPDQTERSPSGSSREQRTCGSVRSSGTPGVIYSLHRRSSYVCLRRADTAVSTGHLSVPALRALPRPELRWSPRRLSGRKRPTPRGAETRSSVPRPADR